MRQEIETSNKIPNRTERDEYLGITYDETPLDPIEIREKKYHSEELAIEQEKLKKLRRDIEQMPPAATHTEDFKTNNQEFLGIPEYLRDESGTSAIKYALDAFLSVEGMETARKRLPKSGPFLVVSNHSGGETGALLALLKNQDAHIAAGEELNFKRSRFRAWLLRKLRMIPVKESLSGLTGQEKTELLERVPERAKAGYQAVIERETRGEMTINNNFLRSAVALLTRGDVVVAFPEGLFLYDGKKSLRKAYGGVELLAKRYKQLTGQDLTIVPVAIIPSDKERNRKRNIKVGDTFTLNESQKTDYMMERLAKIMPEELKGYYGTRESSQ